MEAKKLTKENFVNVFGVGSFVHESKEITIEKGTTEYNVTITENGNTKSWTNARRCKVYSYIFGENQPAEGRKARTLTEKTTKKRIEVEKTPEELYNLWEAQQLAKLDSLAEVLGEKMAESAKKKITAQKGAKIKEFEQKIAKRASYKQDLEKASSEEEVARKALVALLKAGDTAGARDAFTEWEKKATAKKNAAQKLELI